MQLLLSFWEDVEMYIYLSWDKSEISINGYFPLSVQTLFYLMAVFYVRWTLLYVHYTCWTNTATRGQRTTTPNENCPHNSPRRKIFLSLKDFHMRICGAPSQQQFI